MLVLVASWFRQVPQLLQKQRILQNPLNWLYQVRLQSTRVLLLRISGGQKFLQRLIPLILKAKSADKYSDKNKTHRIKLTGMKNFLGLAVTSAERTV